MSSTIPRRFLSALLAVAFAAPAAADQWQTVMRDRERLVEVDRSSIIQSDGGTKVAWGRIVLTQEEASQAGYATIKALNRYDCFNRSFYTIKRVYLDPEQLVLREEGVTDPNPVMVARNSVDERMWREVCKPASGADLTKVAGEAGRAADAAAASAAKASPGDAAKAGSAAMAEDGQAEKAPVRSAEFRPVKKPVADELTRTAAMVEAATPAAAPMVPQPAPAAAVPARAPAPTRVAEAPRSTRSAPATTRSSRSTAASRAAAEAAKATAHRDIHWSYDGETGPDHWGRLRPEWKLCAEGRRQSPIDIRDGVKVDLEPLRLDYRDTHFRINDNGHTIQVDVGEGLGMEVRGRRYELIQFHFHRPSEERVGGRAFDMVAHLVHRDLDGRLAVLAVLLERAEQPNPLMQTLWNNLPLERGTSYMPSAVINLLELLPANPDHYLYMGSLTTPPCTEDVLWVVMKQPMQVSDEQIRIFARLYPRNSRTLQPANGRLILESR